MHEIGFSQCTIVLNLGIGIEKELSFCALHFDCYCNL